MIYTQYGIPVEIIGVLYSTYTGETQPITVHVRSVDDPTWTRSYNPADLKADGGAKEIDEVISKFMNEVD